MHADDDTRSSLHRARAQRLDSRGFASAGTAWALAACACIAWVAATPEARLGGVGSHPAGATNDGDASRPCRGGTSLPEGGAPSTEQLSTEQLSTEQLSVKQLSVEDCTSSEHGAAQGSGPASAPAHPRDKARYADLAEPRPLDSDRPRQLPDWERHSCAKCHAEVAREWASSTHAMAWIDPRYQEALADMKRPESCHNCHIPAPLHLHAADGKPPQKPATRPLATSAAGEPRDDADIHFGVTCATCHEGRDGTILGPRGGATDAHPTRMDESFTDAGADRLCISCHATSVGPVVGIAKDFVDSRQRETHGLSCVGCHMQPLERPIAAEEGKPAYPARSTRSHALQTPRDPAFAARALAIVVEPMGADGTLVALRNTTGHRVPGLVGREFLAEASLRDADGKELAREELVVDRSTAIPADGAAHMELPANSAAREVLVVIRHLGPGMDDPVELKRESVQLPRD